MKTRMFQKETIHIMLRMKLKIDQPSSLDVCVCVCLVEVGGSKRLNKEVHLCRLILVNRVTEFGPYPNKLLFSFRCVYHMLFCLHLLKFPDHERQSSFVLFCFHHSGLRSLYLQLSYMK